MKKRTATVLAFAIASAIPALQFTALAVVSEMRNHTVLPSETPLFSMISFLVFYPYSILFAVVFGVPIYLVVHRLGAVTLWSALAAGVSVGVLVAMIIRSANEPYWGVFLKCVPAAAVAALVFWLIWKRGRAPTMIG